MTRTFWTWSLLLLALSPFTTPYATCDLATLLGRGPVGVTMTTRGVRSQPFGVASHGGETDASAVSPVASRCVLSRPMPAIAHIVPAFAALHIRRSRQPYDQPAGQQPDPQQRAVLRV